MGTTRLKLFMSVFLTIGIVTLPAVAFGQKTLKIGVIAALTGFGSAAEIHVRDGAVMCATWINERGGITAKRQKYLIKTVEEDQKGTAEGAVAAAEKLIHDHKVKFIVGGVVPYMHIAAGKVTEAAKVIRAVMYSCETPAELGSHTPYTFKVNPGSIDGIGPSLDYLVEKYPKVKTIGTITPADGAENYLIPMIAKAAEARKLTQKIAVTWPHDTVDFYPIVTKLLTPSPDAICIMTGWEMATGQMIKAAREKGFKGPIFMNNYDCPYDVIEIAGRELVYDFWTHGWSQDLNDPQLTAEMKKVISTAKAKLGKFHQWNLWGWNGMWCVAQAIEKAQSIDPTEVAKAWKQMETIQTVFGPGKMGGLKTYGVKNQVCSRVAITEVREGKVKHIKWVDVFIQ
jgi:branched-chain amino acid transport system substrate-binding protein